jgi:hypothetical protein
LPQGLTQRSPLRLTPSIRSGASTGIARLSWHHRLSADDLAKKHWLEVGVTRDGVLVQPADEATLLEDVQARGVAPGSARVQLDCLNVLLTAKDEFSLALTLRRRAPDRKRHAQQDGHDAQPNEQCRHGVAALVGHGSAIKISVVAVDVLPSMVSIVTVTVNVPSAV